MSIDTTKEISSVSYNGTNIPLAGGGSDVYENTTLVDIQSDIETNWADLKQIRLTCDTTISCNLSYQEMTAEGILTPVSSTPDVVFVAGQEYVIYPETIDYTNSAIWFDMGKYGIVISEYANCTAFFKGNTFISRNSLFFVSSGITFNNGLTGMNITDLSNVVFSKIELIY